MWPAIECLELTDNVVAKPNEVILCVHIMYTGTSIITYCSQECSALSPAIATSLAVWKQRGKARKITSWILLHYMNVAHYEVNLSETYTFNYVRTYENTTLLQYCIQLCNTTCLNCPCVQPSLLLSTWYDGSVCSVCMWQCMYVLQPVNAVPVL